MTGFVACNRSRVTNLNPTTVSDRTVLPQSQDVTAVWQTARGGSHDPLSEQMFRHPWFSTAVSRGRIEAPARSTALASSALVLHGGDPASDPASDPVFQLNAPPTTADPVPFHVPLVKLSVDPAAVVIGPFRVSVPTDMLYVPAVRLKAVPTVNAPAVWLSVAVALLIVRLVIDWLSLSATV